MSRIGVSQIDADQQTMEYVKVGGRIAWMHPAGQEAVDLVLAKDVEDEDGRSEWLWIRLANGDLILGVFPQGDTYFEVEIDASESA